MADATCRAIRLIMLIHLLSDRSWRATELARRLEVSRRTIYRDLADLQDEPLRVPLVVEDGQWRLFRRSDLN